MRTNVNHLAVTTALAVVACAMSACSSSSSSSPTTTGDDASAVPAANAEPLVLSVGTDDFETMPGAQQVQRFADEVATRSDGAIEIAPQWHAAGGTPHWDQAIATMLMDGSWTSRWCRRVPGTTSA